MTGSMMANLQPDKLGATLCVLGADYVLLGQPCAPFRLTPTEQPEYECVGFQRQTLWEVSRSSHVRVRLGRCSHLE